MSIQLSTTSIQQIQPIFNREEELRVIRSHISATEDASFVVVIGPPRTGKSTILTKIKQERDQLRKNKRDAAPVIFIDCWGTDVTTPEGFAAAARMQIGGWRWDLGRFLNKVWAKLPFSSSLLSHCWIPTNRKYI
jgi:ABC-type phosphate transport system ATPase subunit